MSSNRLTRPNAEAWITWAVFAYAAGVAVFNAIRCLGGRL